MVFRNARVRGHSVVVARSVKFDCGLVYTATLPISLFPSPFPFLRYDSLSSILSANRYTAQLKHALSLFCRSQLLVETRHFPTRFTRNPIPVLSFPLTSSLRSYHAVNDLAMGAGSSKVDWSKQKQPSAPVKVHRSHSKHGIDDSFYDAPVQPQITRSQSVKSPPASAATKERREKRSQHHRAYTETALGNVPHHWDPHYVSPDLGE